jgi:hypothetical protein
MVKRCGLALLLAIQAAGGGAVTLAHARDVVAAPASVEASHDARCAILHDELRCALCHYAGARVVVQQTLLAPTPHVSRIHVIPAQPAVTVVSAIRLTAPARAPPPLLS